MSIREQLVTLLKSVPSTGGRVYWMVAPQDAQGDLYVVYQFITSVPENTMEGNGNPPIQQCRPQIDIYGKSAAAVAAVADGIEAAMRGWTVQNVQSAVRDLYEPDTKLYRISFDFSVWY